MSSMTGIAVRREGGVSELSRLEAVLFYETRGTVRILAVLRHTQQAAQHAGLHRQDSAQRSQRFFEVSCSLEGRTQCTEDLSILVSEQQYVLQLL